MSRQALAVEVIPARIADQPGHRLMIILAAPGCAWASTEGCSNCSFPSFGTGQPVSAEDYTAQLEAAVAGRPAPSGPLRVELFVSGSFLNPEEVPEAGQEALIFRAAAVPGVRSILIESRPEYITAAALDRVLAAAGAVPLTVAIGLESADADIRERRINKGFTWDDFAAAAARIAAAGASLLVYILLKPIATTEAEAMADAIASAEQVFALAERLGVPTSIGLEPCFVGPGTALAEAHAAGRYRPPWLWSVFAVVRLIAPLGRIEVGLSDEGLNPAQVAHNCERCSAAARRALVRFNQTHDPTVLDDPGLSCPCHAEWSGDHP